MVDFASDPALKAFFIDRVVGRRAWAMEEAVIAALAAAGECAWTARDTFTIFCYPDGRFEVV